MADLEEVFELIDFIFDTYSWKNERQRFQAFRKVAELKEFVRKYTDG